MVKKLTKEEWKEVETALYEKMPRFVMHKQLKAKSTYAYKLSTLRSNLKKDKVVKSFGLCCYVKSDHMSLFLSRYWPKWSGDISYPIVDKKYGRWTCPERQYHYKDKWSGNQLKLRTEYAKFLLANLNGYCLAVKKALKKAEKDIYDKQKT